MSSIGNTLNSINRSLLAEIQSLNGNAASTVSSTTTAAAANPPDQVNLSQVSSLFQQLQQLQTSNPAEFKQVLADGAQQLQAAAAQQTDPNATAFLNNLAAKFQTAADTGNLAALNPQAASGAAQGTGSAHGHHHHHGGGGDNDSTASTSTATSSTSSTAPTATAPQNGTSLLNLLSALNSQNPQSLFSGLIAPPSNGSNSANPLLSILAASGNTGGNSAQIQTLLASFINLGTSSLGTSSLGTSSLGTSSGTGGVAL